MISTSTQKVAKLAQGLVTFCSLVIFRFGIVVVVVVVKYLRGKTGNLMRPTGNGGFL